MERKIKSNYKISELAEEDMLAIFLTGMENFGIKRAKQYYLAIEDIFNQLENFPDMGKSRDELFPGALSFSAGSHIILITEYIEMNLLKNANKNNLLRLMGKQLPSNPQ